MNSARTYELIYVLKPDAPEDEVNNLHGQVAEVVDRMGGKIDKTDQWGRRKMAYEIGHHKEGFYVLEVISGSGELMKELDRRLKVTEGLLRHLIVRVDESTIKADRARTRRTEESRRRRVARGLPPDRQPGEGPQGMDDDDGNDMMFDGPDMEER